MVFEADFGHEIEEQIKIAILFDKTVTYLERSFSLSCYLEMKCNIF